jgi:hypothetical protein
MDDERARVRSWAGLTGAMEKAGPLAVTVAPVSEVTATGSRRLGQWVTGARVQPVNRQRLSAGVLAGGCFLIVMAVGRLVAHLTFGWSSYADAGTSAVVGVLFLLVGAWLDNSADTDAEK